MISCSIGTWIGFWIFGLVAGMLLIGLVRTPSERERQ